MNLVTPDTGLLFWMVIIFGLLFFILAKFGFPIITSMVEKRNAAIDKSLKDAEEVEAMMVAAMKEHDEMIADAGHRVRFSRKPQKPKTPSSARPVKRPGPRATRFSRKPASRLPPKRKAPSGTSARKWQSSPSACRRKSCASSFPRKPRARSISTASSTRPEASPLTSSRKKKSIKWTPDS